MKSLKKSNITNKMKILNIDEYEVKIGQNAKENWKILDNSEETDVFFHLSKLPSCYVIIRNDSEEYPDFSVLKKACSICLEHTKYRNLRNIKVDYTMCSNLKKGKILGEVIYQSSKKVKSMLV